MNAVAIPVENYIADSIAEGFFFECGCGEQYDTVAAAASCRKCRSYSVFGWCTHVTDLRTGDVVWGEKPSQEEYEAQAERAQWEWEQERAELAELYPEDRQQEEWEVYETKAEEAGY